MKNAKIVISIFFFFYMMSSNIRAADIHDQVLWKGLSADEQTNAWDDIRAYYNQQRAAQREAIIRIQQNRQASSFFDDFSVLMRLAEPTKTLKGLMAAARENPSISRKAYLTICVTQTISALKTHRKDLVRFLLEQLRNDVGPEEFDSIMTSPHANGYSLFAPYGIPAFYPLIVNSAEYDANTRKSDACTEENLRAVFTQVVLPAITDKSGLYEISIQGMSGVLYRLSADEYRQSFKHPDPIDPRNRPMSRRHDLDLPFHEIIGYKE